MTIPTTCATRPGGKCATGLFAANPFGKRYFERLKDVTAGNYTIPNGKSVAQKDRFYFHKGDTKAAKVGAEYGAWTK